MHYETRLQAGEQNCIARFPAGAPQLSIIVPTYNEHENVEPIVERVSRVLAERHWELIFVDDDSPDGTHDVAKNLAHNFYQVRCIRRIGRRGLSSAVIEGILSSSSKYVAVMDGDLQHDERLLPLMLSELENDRADVVIASRYVADGNAEGLDGVQRQTKSRLGNLVVQRLLRLPVADPMSGFFMLPRAIFEEGVRSLSGRGYKILLDFLTSTHRSLRLAEVPMQFRSRRSGESKLDTSVEIAFAIMLLDKTIGRYIPTRFFLFGFVGSSGVFLHLVVLKLLLLFGAPFAFAQGASALCAMTSNFLLNNAITFSDRRLRGWSILTGMVTFAGICSIGLLGNVGVAHVLFSQKNSWWLSGLMGAAVGAVWNYSASSVYTWRAK